jgi:elongation factor P
MGVKATELRKGTVIELDGDLWLVTDYMHHTPGNLRAIIHTKLKNLKSGSSRDMRLGSGDVLEVAYLDKKPCEYLYKEVHGGYVFMDSESYEQFTMPEDLIGDRMPYVKENTQALVTFHKGLPIGVELPAAVVLEVIEADPAVRGNTATNVKKDAVVETGLRIRVPIFISKGEKVKIRTEDGEFLGRVND